jgi:DNA polymerase-3 subunit delta'
MAAAEVDEVVSRRVEPARYPWHDASWAGLTRDPSRLPHALLLHGQAGLGKQALALRFAQFLLCADRTTEPCGKCHGCHLFRAGNHPDLLRIAPQEDSSNILIDQVRGVVEFLSLKAHSGAHKVVIIAPAEAMNVNAANSLLKILEEPPAGSILILVATHLARVSVTLRSRCRRLSVEVPATAQALAWLASQKLDARQAESLLGLAGGAPLMALQFAQEGYLDTGAALAGDLAALGSRRADPVACAERWKQVGTETSLEWLQRFLSGALRARADALGQPRIPIQVQGSSTFSLSIIDLFAFLDRVSIGRTQLGSGLDENLLLEELLIRWCEIAEPTP